MTATACSELILSYQGLSKKGNWVGVLTIPRPTSPTIHFLLAFLDLLLAAAFTSVGETQMNSLAYLSRQFDVLASPRTPPSTPASEVPPSVAAETRSGRARSWSTKILRVPSPGGSPERSWTLKRSLSSPAVNAIASVNEPGPYFPRRLSAAPSTQAARSSSRRPSLSQTEKATRPKTASESILRSLLFVRIILQLWHSICVAWRSLTRQEPARIVEEVAVEDVSDEEKDTEDESKDEKPVSLDHLESPFQPAIAPPPLHPSPPPPPPAIFPPPPPGLTVSHPLSETTSPQEPQASVQTAPIPSSSSPADLSTPQHVQTPSRTSTPGVAAHKTPFHLPKTLVLDLDETLIHSTSRPMHSGSSGGGLLGIFGRGNKGAGHVVEVVLGGRSTLYHVYKRPFVDYFLRKVSLPRLLSDDVSILPSGVGVVHARCVHGINARIRRPRYRLARRRPGNSDPALLQRGVYQIIDRLPHLRRTMAPFPSRVPNFRTARTRKIFQLLKPTWLESV